MTVIVEPDPTEEDRYGLYVRDLVDGKRELRRIAETSLDGIGSTLLQLADDRRELGGSPTEVVGVLDRIERRWISGVWQGGRRKGDE